MAEIGEASNARTLDRRWQYDGDRPWDGDHPGK